MRFLWYRDSASEIEELQMPPAALSMLDENGKFKPFGTFGSSLVQPTDLYTQT